MSTPPKPAPKQKSESELLAQLEKLQQEISVNLPTNVPTAPKPTNATTTTPPKTIGVKRKLDGQGSGPPKKIAFIPRTIHKEEKVISAAPTYNFNNFIPVQQEEQQQLLTDYYVQQQSNRFHKQKSSAPTFEDEASSNQSNSKKVIRKAAGETWEDPTLAEWPDNDYRIFVGDLGNEVNDDILTKAFNKYPSFVKARVVFDKKTNKPKGFGFVGFTNAQDYVDALQQMDGKYIGNRPCKLRRSRWKDRNA